MSELSDLFAKDPLKLTRPERDEMVTHLRANRERYVAGVKAPSAKGTSKTPVPEGGLNLEDLGL